MRKNILQEFISYVNKSNRIYVIAWFFVLFFFTIAWSMFKYTVLDYKFYRGLADKQQIWQVTVPVTRWTIYSWNEKETILGTSLNLYDISIDPQSKWDINKLQTFLTDIVYNQYCHQSTYKECYAGITKFLRVLEIEDFVKSEEYIKWLVSEYLGKKLAQKKVTSVFIDKELDEKQISQISQLWVIGLYPTWNFLYVNPEELTNNELVAEKLSPIMGIEKERLEKIIRKRVLRYMPILKKLTISTSEYVRNYIEDEKKAIKAGLIKSEEWIKNFIILEAKPHRYYPEKEVGSQVIGFVDKEGTGHYWIEWYFHDILKWNNGKIVSRKDVKWRIINSIDLKKEDFIGEWVEIYSTIDRNIQSKVEEILERWVKKWRANKGTVVVMEPKTGRVVAMANYPTYDLNNYSDIYELEKVRYSKYPNPSIDLLGYPVFVEDFEKGQKFYYDREEIYLRRATRAELWNIALVKYKYKNDFWPGIYKNDAISSVYEPGSIMKAISVAIWLDSGEINKNSMYLDEWEVTIAGFTIKNVSDKCLGYHSFGHSLNYSCNVWMIRIFQRVERVLVNQYFQAFGFWKETWISLSWEVGWSLEPWESIWRTKLFTNSYGLGVSVTPLQMAAAYSTLANGGLYIKPRILDKIEFADNKKIIYKSEIERRVIQESTSKMITKMLVDWVNNWVAKNGAVEWYSVAGKTGTAQIPYKGVYCKWNCVGQTNGSFAWFGPAEDPKFVAIVKLERPRGGQWYGWSTSAFVFAEIAEYLFKAYEIPRKEIEKK